MRRRTCDRQRRAKTKFHHVREYYFEATLTSFGGKGVLHKHPVTHTTRNQREIFERTNNDVHLRGRDVDR